jgi:predicted RNase H-like HicB family nuclease
MSRFILTEYIESAMEEAEYDKLEDDSFSGRIPSCTGLIAFSNTLSECEKELRSTLEDWIFVGLKLGQPLPVINGFDLRNRIHYRAAHRTDGMGQDRQINTELAIALYAQGRLSTSLFRRHPLQIFV